MMFRLAGSDQHLGLIPKHIVPSECKNFAGNANAAVARKCNNQLPFDIGSLLNRLINDCSTDESQPLRVFLRARFDLGEWTFADQFAIHGIFEKLPRSQHYFSHVSSRVLSGKISLEVQGIGDGDFRHRLVGTKECHQLITSLFESRDGPSLHIGLAPTDISIDHFPKYQYALRGRQSSLCQSIGGNTRM
ncbi:MAG TPA: hypothetical protein VGG19_14145 [Tepidisphaeraceae bacterium]